MISAAVWLLAGVTVGGVNALLIGSLIARLDPAEIAGVRRRIWLSYAVRYVFAAALLALALRQNLASGLLAGTGLWVARWLAVYLGASGKLIQT